ncbi:MAG: hypothetical protein GY834_10595 [Bacteroidetes bacterium]|nr:hypothetical protein [Bacteroidota bacterium]
MTSRLKMMLLFLCAAFLSSCAYTAQQANINPEISLKKTSEGHGATLLVEVLDERSDKVLGHRGGGYGKGAEITTNQDLVALLQQELFECLAQKGFKPTSCDEGEKPNLTFELRLLEYSTSTGFWTGGVHTKAAVKAIANVKDDTYKKIYRVDNEKRVMVVPTAKENEELFNQLLEDMLVQIFQDKELLSTIAKIE